MTEEHRTYHARADVLPVKRMSWGAIFAGAILVLMIQVTLSVIGIAIGLTTINPTSEQDPAAGLATGALIWWFVTALIALFFGGWAAARLSAVWTRTSGLLHGLVMWGLVELVFIWLLTSAVGALIGGAFGIVQSTLSAAPKLLPDVSKIMPETDADIPWQQIGQEVKDILRQTGKPELTPGQLEQEAQKAAETAEQAAGQAVQNPQQAYDEITQALDKLLRQAKNATSEVDRQAVVNVLVKRTTMSRQEARQTVDQWVQLYEKAVPEIKQTAQEVKQEAVQVAQETGEVAADIGAQAAWWSAAMLIAGAIVAALGGAIGTPTDARKTQYPAGY